MFSFTIFLFRAIIKLLLDFVDFLNVLHSFCDLVLVLFNPFSYHHFVSVNKTLLMYRYVANNLLSLYGRLN